MTQQQSHLSPGALLANEEPTKRDRFANGHLIWDTIIELRNTERRINRRALADLTGLKPGVVDDHVERWIEKANGDARTKQGRQGLFGFDGPCAGLDVARQAFDVLCRQLGEVRRVHERAQRLRNCSSRLLSRCSVS